MPSICSAVMVSLEVLEAHTELQCLQLGAARQTLA
jgi:hypothetical protein